MELFGFFKGLKPYEIVQNQYGDVLKKFDLDRSIDILTCIHTNISNYQPNKIRLMILDMYTDLFKYMDDRY